MPGGKTSNRNLQAWLISRNILSCNTPGGTFLKSTAKVLN